MFVTCHITFGQLSNFVRASLEVTRTIINDKLPFTWGCSILLLKKAKGPWNRIPFFFNDSDLFFKYFNSNHNLPSYSLFSKCFSWFFYLGVHRGTGDFSWFCFFTPPLECDSLSRSLRTCLRLTEKRWIIARVLQIQASLMKLGFMVSSFLSFFISKRMVKTRP